MWPCWRQRLERRGCTVMFSKAPSLTNLQVLLALEGRRGAESGEVPLRVQVAFTSIAGVVCNRGQEMGASEPQACYECLLDISPPPRSYPPHSHTKVKMSQDTIQTKLISLPHKTEKTCLPVPLSNQVQLLELRTPDTAHKESSSTTPITPTQ